MDMLVKIPMDESQSSARGSQPFKSMTLQGRATDLGSGKKLTHFLFYIENNSATRLHDAFRQCSRITDTLFVIFVCHLQFDWAVAKFFP